MLRLRPFKPMDAEVIVSWIRDEVMFRQWCADRFGQYPISPQDLIGHYRQMEQEDWFFPFTSFDETGPAGIEFLHHDLHPRLRPGKRCAPPHRLEPGQTGDAGVSGRVPFPGSSKHELLAAGRRRIRSVLLFPGVSVIYPTHLEERGIYSLLYRGECQRTDDPGIIVIRSLSTPSLPGKTGRPGGTPGRPPKPGPARPQPEGWPAPPTRQGASAAPMTF